METIHAWVVPAIKTVLQTSLVTNCSQRSLRCIQEITIAGHFGRVPGCLKFYEEPRRDQLRMKLEKRAVKDYPTDKGASSSTRNQDVTSFG